MQDLSAYTVDFIIVAMYLSMVVGYGIYQGKKVKTSSEFFIADKRMPWWAVALAFTTLVLSTQDIASYSETGYYVGMTAFNPYISISGLIFLAIALSLPIYYYTGVYTVPEYLKARYNEGTSVAGSIALLIFLLAIMSFNTYAFATIIHGLTGLNTFMVTIVLSVLIAIYASVGGVVAVITVDVLQAIFLVIGGLIVVVLGIGALGGFGELVAWTPEQNLMYTTSIHDEAYPAIGMWMGITIIIAAFYNMHQGILQKCLTTRSMNGCRMTMLIYGLVLLPIGCLFTGLPGMILRALVEKGIVAAPAAGTHIYAYLLNSVVPHGALGLVIAGCLAAMVSTTDSYLNSAVTVFVNDIYQKLNKGKPDRHYLTLARILTYVVGIGVPILFVQYFMRIPYLMAAFYSISSAVVPGLLIAVVVGMTSKKFKAKAATAAILASIVGTMLSIFIPSVFLKPFCFGVDWTAAGASWFQTVAGFVWAVAAAAVFSFLPEKKKSEQELFGLVRNHPRIAVAKKAYYFGLTEGVKGVHLLSPIVKQRYMKENEEYVKIVKGGGK